MSPNQIAYSLDADSYLSQDFFKKELESIFYRNWQYVCHKSQVPNPGDFHSSIIGKQEIFLVQGKDNIVRGFYNVCPHRAHPIVKGCGNKQMLVCPYHSWTFFLNGQFCKAQGTQNIEGFDPSIFNLSEVRIEEFLGFYFTNFDEKSPSLKNLSGNLESEISQIFPNAESLGSARRIQYEIKANWKVFVDNRLESASPRSEKSLQQGIYTRLNSYCWWLWPNHFLIALPDHSSLAILHIKASEADFTHEIIDIFTTKPSLEFDASIIEVLLPKNNDICEQVQRGLGSRAYQRGPLFINAESSDHAILHFHSLVQDALSRLRVSNKLLRSDSRNANAPV